MFPLSELVFIQFYVLNDVAFNSFFYDNLVGKSTYCKSKLRRNTLTLSIFLGLPGRISQKSHWKKGHIYLLFISSFKNSKRSSRFLFKISNIKNSHISALMTNQPVGGISWHPAKSFLVVGHDENVSIYHVTKKM